tara:strand:- start:16 stop:126 length:111 start_codon:yes stop_codon:yes gene_type:complete
MYRLLSLVLAIDGMQDVLKHPGSTEIQTIQMSQPTI